jgi:hypothetical protein
MGSSVCNSRFCVNLFARVRAGQNLIELDCPDAENASFFHHDRGAASLQKMDVEHCLQLVFLGRDEILYRDPQAVPSARLDYFVLNTTEF